MKYLPLLRPFISIRVSLNLLLLLHEYQLYQGLLALSCHLDVCLHPINLLLPHVCLCLGPLVPHS